MTLFKLAVSNIKKSMKDFAIYFITLLFGICLFYVFNSIESQSSMVNLSSSSQDMVKMIQQIISYLSVFIAFILGFLIIYASRFMMRRRNKEFALYMLLGMGKRKVSLILFVENLIVGIFSLVVGLLAGVGLSQVTSVFVAYLFEADLTGYKFVFSQSAFTKTCIYFAIIYMIVIFFNTIAISKCKLITLLQSNRRSEKIKNRFVFLRVIGFFVGVAVVGYGYYLVTGDYYGLTENRLLIAIICGIVGTFIFFWSLSGIIFTVCSKRKKSYHKGLNSFVIRQFSSQASTNVISISIICILFFVTICCLASAFNIRNSMNKNLDTCCPADYQFSVDGEESYINEIDNRLADFDKYNKDSVKVYNTNTRVYFSESGFSSETTEGEMFFYIGKIFSETEYNKLAEYYGQKKVSLRENEYAIISNYNEAKLFYKDYLQNKPVLDVGDKGLVQGFDEAIDGFYMLSETPMCFGIFVVSDEAAEGLEKTGVIYTARYSKDYAKNVADTDKEVKDLYAEKIEKCMPEEGDNLRGISYAFKTEIAEMSVGTGAMATFIALYIGFILLLSGAAILAIKELSESVDNKNRYQMLRKIGADEKMINHALFRQIGWFFVLPLLLAIVHSIAGMKFSTKVMSIFGTDEIGNAILITGGIFAVIYGIYFLITYFTSKRMIREKI